MDTLSLRDVRCFRGSHEAPLAPITLLVGENSTGKSTFLALLRIAWDIAYGTDEPDFNEEPFQLGSYNEIAHYHGGQGKRARSFSIGLTEERPRRTESSADSDAVTVRATFSPTAGQPTLSTVRVESGPWAIEAESKGDEVEYRLTTPDKEFAFAADRHFPIHSLSAPNLLFILQRFPYLGLGSKHFSSHAAAPTQKELEALGRALHPLHGRTLRARRTQGRPLAMAPVRTQPKRTYDPLKEVRSPQGGHVPMLLATTYTNEPKWRALSEGLEAFGRESGLFDEVIVRRFAGSESTPFQIRVRLAGQKKEVNLVDVGYGVSQVLPIIVDALAERRPTTFLIQQPEVHLHPRAQAALATFLAPLLRERRHRFVIETHSDHIIDRLRLLAREGRISHRRIQVLYFDRSGAQVKISRIGLDSAGNMRGAPPGYREFFLEEELKLISP